MTDLFKQLFDASSDRIRSPFFGSMLISFFGFNWRELFYLLLADKPVRARILYFDANTDVWNIFVYPAAVGISLALLMPWASYLGAIVARLPRANLHSLQHGEVIRKRIHEYEQKAKEEEAISRLEAATEQRRIDAAKRLEEAEGVSVELGEALSEDRSLQQPEVQKNNSEFLLNTMPEYSIQILASIARSNIGQMRVGIENILFAGLPSDSIAYPKHRRERMKLSTAVEWLSDSGLIDRLRLIDDESGIEVFQITEKGYLLQETLEKRPPF